MSRHSIRLLASTAAVGVAAVALAGCAVPFPVVGDQTQGADDFTVSDSVRGLLLEAAGDAKVTIGDEPQLTISGPESTLERVTVDERNGMLVIGARGPGINLRSLTVTLTVTAFDELEVAGAGDVTAEFTPSSDVRITVGGAGDVDATGIDAESVTVAIGGAGSVVLTGEADSAEYSVDGAGEIDATGLVARDATAKINGAGAIALHATGTADAQTSGIGEITIRGGADVTRRVDGLGTITEE
ncbi:head GIN domain-containing protein [Salinibacterium sp. ZJ77]|uniref:head GIN domain-containing protein n=1 Tax=Salinibacterium sp. ZJ77 TaxID=2708337 RepID=UPI0014206873|nr:head GIN domain-containing protein [Salinibacterium sp. ZJ77]